MLLSWRSVGPRLFAFYFIARIKWNVFVFICSCVTWTLQRGNGIAISGKRLKVVYFLQTKIPPLHIYSSFSFNHQIVGRTSTGWCKQPVFQSSAGSMPKLLSNMTYLITSSWHDNLRSIHKSWQFFFGNKKKKNSKKFRPSTYHPKRPLGRIKI